MNLCYEARLSLRGKRAKSEHPSMSRDELAELTGRAPSLIAKRERGTTKIVGAATVLYQLIVDMNDESAETMPKAVRALEEVPEKDRSEDRALVALILLCLAEGKIYLARRALGDDTAEPEEGREVDASANVALRTIGRVKDALRRAARKAGTDDARVLREIAADLARGHERLEMFVESLEDSKDPPEDGS